MGAKITFRGLLAIEKGQGAVAVTERCVFELFRDGVTLTEIAPGMDLQRDILDNMGFVPIISPKLRTTDVCIFTPGRMACFD